MSAEIIPFIPKPNPNRPSLHEEAELRAAAFLKSAPALVPYVETVGFTETIPYGGKGIDGMDLGPERA